MNTAKQAARQWQRGVERSMLNYATGSSPPLVPLDALRESYASGRMSLGAFEIAVEALLRSKPSTARS